VEGGGKVDVDNNVKGYVAKFEIVEGGGKVDSPN
jgi:hypothetical protein